MLFNSLEYLLFYIVFFILFFSLKVKRHQILLICVSSIYFYAAWSPKHVLLLIAVTLIAYSSELFFNSRLTPALPIAGVLGLLFTFKYSNFFLDQVYAFGVAVPHVDLILPVGISFYVFQSISFMVDRKRQHFQKAPLSGVIAYVSFFPQLVAGPIVRADVFFPQLRKRQIFNKHMFFTGMLLFAMGMFKKVVIADNMGLFVDKVYASPGGTTAANHILAFYFYAIQIYYDFCGYSEMAIGIARTLGFKFPRNFARPYFVTSITEFWRCWHISLSSWFRDYLYIPLGGNRLGQFRLYFNLAVVMLLCGLWHGAAWTFVAWGAGHGVLLSIERIIGYKPRRKISRVLAGILIFHLVSISWVFFRSPDFVSAIKYFHGMADVGSIAVITSKFSAIKCIFLALLFIVIELYSHNRIFFSLRRKHVLIPLAIVYSALFLLFGNFSETPFIYFQF